VGGQHTDSLLPGHGTPRRRQVTVIMRNGEAFNPLVVLGVGNCAQGAESPSLPRVTAILREATDPSTAAELFPKRWRPRTRRRVLRRYAE
jgi:hypothetical protein